MLQAKVNEKKQFEIVNDDEVVKINGESFNPDILGVDDRKIHLLVSNRSFTAELVRLSDDRKEMLVKINANQYSISLKDKNDILLEKLGMSSMSHRKVDELKAPMPGLILKVLSSDGAQVKKGDGVLVLEAMKMENVIKAPHDGVIKELKVVSGDKVEKNQVLIVFE